MLLLDETERSFEGLDALAIGGLMDGEGVLVGDGEALRHWHQVEMASTEDQLPILAGVLATQSAMPGRARFFVWFAIRNREVLTSAPATSSREMLLRTTADALVIDALSELDALANGQPNARAVKLQRCLEAAAERREADGLNAWSKFVAVSEATQPLEDQVISLTKGLQRAVSLTRSSYARVA